jgi:hypothetical protein
VADKPKRKHHYRRWWAFRGLFIALIVFLGAIGYLLTRQPEAEYIYFFRDENLWRISTIPDATPEFIGEMSDGNYYHRVYYTPANWLIYSTGDWIPIEIRYINLSTGEDVPLLNCATIAFGGSCISFDLHPDGRRLVYNFSYYSSIEQPAPDVFEVRQFDIEQNVDELLLQTPMWLLGVVWVNEHQIEYTARGSAMWSYDFNTGVQHEIDLTNYRLFSPDRSHYVVKSYKEGFMRMTYEYTVYDAADNVPVEGYGFSTESDAPICWQPNGKGLLYHGLSTAVGMPINRLSYYDIESGQNRYIHERDGRDRDGYFFTWSPSSRYILIDNLLYDMQSHTSRQMLENTGFPFWLDNKSYCWLSFPIG